jgi:hypothetical protein
LPEQGLEDVEEKLIGHDSRLMGRTGICQSRPCCGISKTELVVTMRVSGESFDALQMVVGILTLGEM